MEELEAMKMADAACDPGDGVGAFHFRLGADAVGQQRIGQSRDLELP